jgi:hypothetical protein
MENNHFITNDLSLAAYLIMRGCELINSKRLGKTYKFTVNILDYKKHQLQADFMNSESRRFDAAVRDLKKIMFSGD